MFTGLIEALGRVERVSGRQGNKLLVIQAAFAPELKLGDSVAVNGCCLTVVETDRSSFAVEAVAATVQATNLGRLKTGEPVNLERALAVGDRLGGHLVQGHVDEAARIRRIERHSGFHTVAVDIKRENGRLVVPKGSICVDGISLTVAEARPTEFSVNVIPHTWENTNLKLRRTGELVNVEYDMLVKAVQNRASS
jgi:riboflavin synthase